MPGFLPGGGGEGTILFGQDRYVPLNQGMVFRVLSLKQGKQFHYLASLTGCAFWTGSL